MHLQKAWSFQSWTSISFWGLRLSASLLLPWPLSKEKQTPTSKYPERNTPAVHQIYCTLLQAGDHHCYEETESQETKLNVWSRGKVIKDFWAWQMQYQKLLFYHQLSNTEFRQKFIIIYEPYYLPLLKWETLRVPKMVMNFSSSVPHFSSPALNKTCCEFKRSKQQHLLWVHTHCWKALFVLL